jgi:hypothetical protein
MNKPGPASAVPATDFKVWLVLRPVMADLLWSFPVLHLYVEPKGTKSTGEPIFLRFVEGNNQKGPRETLTTFNYRGVQDSK